jgi:RecA/RadA recombinase
MPSEPDPLLINLRQARENFSRRQVFSTGSAAIDGLLGGGYRTSELTEVYGDSTTGKTQLAFQAAVMVASRGGGVAYIYTEGTFRPERIAKIAASRALEVEAVLSKIYCRRATSVEEQMESVSKLNEDQRLRGCKLVVVDTMSNNFALEYRGEKRMLERQSMLSVYLNRIARDAYINDRAVILNTRVASIGSGTGTNEVDLGGSTLRRFVQGVLRLRRRESEVVVSLISETGETRSVSCRLSDGGIE